MLAIYNKAQICTFDKPFDCGLKLYPDLKKIMAHGRDWDELVYVWGEWRRKSGENMKELYEQLVDLTNLAANYNSKTNIYIVHKEKTKKRSVLKNFHSTYAYVLIYFFNLRL